MLKIDERRQKILARLRSEGKVYVSELSHELGVTPVTVRNDLDALEKDGYLERMSGGAVHTNHASRGNLPAHLEDIDRLEAKQAIARKISSFVKDGNTIFISLTAATISAATREG